MSRDSMFVRGCGDVVDASGRPRVAAQDSPDSKADASNDSPLLNGFKRVPRAARVVPADIPVHRRDQLSVRKQQSDAHIPRQQHETHCETLGAIPAFSVAKEQPLAAGSTRITMSTGCSWGRAFRAIAESCRFRRLRTTAPPTFLETMKPKRLVSLRPAAVCTIAYSVCEREPDRTTRRKSSPRTIRCCFANTVPCLR